MSAADTIPLSDILTENKVIAAILRSRDCAENALWLLEPTDFYNTELKEIFKAARRVAEAGDVVNSTSLRLAMGQDYSHGLMIRISAVNTSTGHIDSYCKTLITLAEVRSIMRVGNQVDHLCANWDGDIDQLRDVASDMVNAIAARKEIIDVPPISETVDVVIENMRNPDMSPKVKTNFPTVNRFFNSGLSKSNLYVLGARRGVGKTALAMDITMSALGDDFPVVWVAQEMSKEQMVSRIILAKSGIKTAAKYSNEEMATMEKIGAGIKEQPLTVYDSPINITKLWSYAHRWHVTGRMKLMVVDYIQIMQMDETENEVTGINKVVRGLKHIAQKFKIPVLALSQARREGEKQTPRIYMSQLKGSGSIEEHADGVILAWPSEDPWELNAEVAKNRHGPTGEFKINCDFGIMQFSEQTSFEREEEEYDHQEPDSPPEPAPKHNQAHLPYKD